MPMTNEQQQSLAESLIQSVAITDIHMPFGSMVVFMIKWAIAAIPALIILGLIYLMFFAVIVGMFRGSHF